MSVVQFAFYLSDALFQQMFTFMSNIWKLDPNCRNITVIYNVILMSFCFLQIFFNADFRYLLKHFIHFAVDTFEDKKWILANILAITTLCNGN